MNLVASGDGEGCTGSSEKEHIFGDGHGYHCSAAGTGNGCSCGYGNPWEKGHSFQGFWEAGGNASGNADGYGYANGHGYAFSEED